MHLDVKVIILSLLFLVVTLNLLCSRTGNPFNTSVIPSPPPPALPPLLVPSGAPSPLGAPSPQLTPGKQAFGPSAPITQNSPTGGNSLTARRVTWIAIAGLLVCIVLALGLCLCMSRCSKRSQPASEIAKSREMDAYSYPKEPKIDESFSKLYSPAEKGIFIFKPLLIFTCSRLNILLRWFCYGRPLSIPHCEYFPFWDVIFAKSKKS